jgi:nicotinamidase-related amidase
VRSLQAFERRTAVLVGLETDVCIAQSAIGLVGLGYRVVVLADAVGAPGGDHDYGIERMRHAGAVVSGVKGLFYEWMGTVERSERFHAECDAILGIPDSVRQ